MKKIVLGVSVFALALVLGVSVVSAQTTTTTTTTSESVLTQFNRNLTIGSSGSDVAALQTILIAQGHLVMPAGVAKGYFGTLTQSAVAKWQASVGISPAAGYFGPISRAAINNSTTTTTTTGLPAGCTSTAGFSSTTGARCDSGSTLPAGCVAGAMFSSTTGQACTSTTTTTTTTTTNTGPLSGGEASLESFDLSSGDDADVEEGDSAEIAEIEFDVEDGDVRINRVDIALVGDAGQEEEDPWDTFESARLLIDGKEVGEVDLSDEDEYLDEDEGTVRFSDIDAIVREGDTATIVVEITAQNSVDGADANDSVWTINVLDNGIRATDAEGIEQYIGDDSDTVEFSVEVEGEGEELNVSSSNEDIDTETFIIEDDARSDWHSIFAFDIEAEESEVALDSVRVKLTTSSTSTLMISDLILEIDGEEFDDWSYVGTSIAGSSTVEFDIDGDFTIDADSEVTAVLKAEFKAANLSGIYSATTTNTIAASVITGAVEGEGADDIDSTGTASGDTHTLAVEGLSVDAPTTKTAVAVTNDADSATDDEGKFTFEFEVEALEEAAFIKLDTERGASGSPSAGINFVIETSNGVATTTGTYDATVELVSGGDEDGGYAEIEEGETATLKVIVNFNPAHVTGTGVSYRARLVSVNFNDAENTAPDAERVLSPEQDFRTSFVSVQN